MLSHAGLNVPSLRQEALCALHSVLDTLIHLSPIPCIVSQLHAAPELLNLQKLRYENVLPADLGGLPVDPTIPNQRLVYGQVRV